MLDGLHLKLLGYGLVPTRVAPQPVVRAGAAIQQQSAYGERVGCERIRTAGEFHSLPEHRNSRSFIGSHQGWLLQLLGQVAVE